MAEYISLLRCNSNYRFLWIGSVISQLGDWFNLLASAALITEISDSSTAISYLFLARFLPLFFFSPLAGVLADRYSRRFLLIASDVFRAVIVLGFLFINSPGQIWLLYLLTVIQFSLSAMFTPARTAVLANVVSREELVPANALDSFTWSTMLALGALLGGIVAAVFGKDTAFIMDAVTFLGSAWAISRIRIPAEASKTIVRQTGWLDFVDGFRYLRSVPFILSISLVKGAGSLVWGAINVLEIPFANKVYPLSIIPILEALHIEDGGTATLGIIYLVSGIGTGFGPLVMRHWLGDHPGRLLVGMTVGFVLTSAGILTLGFVGTLPLFLGGTLIRTVGTGTLWVFSAVLLQMLVPNRFRGRVFAFEFAILTLTQSISILAAGFMQDNLGWNVQQASITIGWLGVAVTGIWIVAYAVRLRAYGRFSL